MPSISNQRRDEKPRDEEVVDNSFGELFVGSNHASPPGQPNVTHPIMPFEAMEAMFAVMEAMARYDKYANGAIGAMTGTGNSIRRSAQQSWVPPSKTQSTSRGGMPDQGSPSPSPSSRPAKAKKGKSRANIQYNSGPRQIISGCYNPKVQNDTSFNNNNYYDYRAETRQEDQEDTSPEEEEDD